MFSAMRRVGWYNGDKKAKEAEKGGGGGGGGGASGEGESSGFCED